MNNWKIVPQNNLSHLYVPLIFGIEGYSSSDHPDNEKYYLEEFLNQIRFEAGGEPGWYIKQVEQENHISYEVWNSLELPDIKTYSEEVFWGVLQKILSEYVKYHPHMTDPIHKTISKYCPENFQDKNVYNK